MIQLLRLPAVLELVGLRRSSVYQLVKNNKFPRPVRLAGGGAIAWRSDEVAAWIDGLARADVATSNRGGVDAQAGRRKAA